ncbi:hypothetical protein NUU61_008533 [Penicillium alfredii]|uniref:Rhodopsin domain-containing protein n=1 Tax=Penicillium alfredii TaxID=1506179 RepID=A0A9W9JW21_9EURO|nr:uncharacterized protein NUU61_008533 [Penicillium alfredii]KAJ5083954.1 hypothetical protein NUU61_008533 [Penicillium alfredii]
MPSTGWANPHVWCGARGREEKIPERFVAKFEFHGRLGRSQHAVSGVMEKSYQAAPCGSTTCHGLIHADHCNEALPSDVEGSHRWTSAFVNRAGDVPGPQILIWLLKWTLNSAEPALDAGFSGDPTLIFFLLSERRWRVRAMELPPPPPGLDIYEDNTSRVIASVLAPAIIAVIAVGLRIWARYVSKAKFYWDDYLIIVALVFSSGNCVLNILMAKLGGMGKHIWNPSVDLGVIWQLVFAMEFVYSCTIPAIKMSVIMFYHRIFPIQRFTYVLYFCSFLALGWFFGVMVVNLVQCHPISYFWKKYEDPTAKGTCIDVEAYFMGNGIAEAVTDWIILAVPFHRVWKLNMPTPQKLAVLGIFGLGAFACIAGALRCYAVEIMTESLDIPWNFGRGFIWSSIEPSLGIISACLPTLRPLFRYLYPTGFASSQKPSDFYRLQDRENFRSGNDGVAPNNAVRKGSEDSEARLQPKNDAIMVRQDSIWSSKQSHS